MRISAKRMATCSMMVTLSVVLMLLGAVLELGIYACPMFVGLCFIPVGQKYGRMYHIVLYVATSILCFLLVPNVEENLMFVGLFGWYPIVRPTLQKMPRFLRWIVKLLTFNVAIIAVEWLVMAVFIPEVVVDALLWVLLILGNIVFFLYDFLIPKMDVIVKRFDKWHFI